jgi:hypothetical protein
VFFVVRVEKMTDGFDKQDNTSYGTKVIYEPLGKHSCKKHTLKMTLCQYFTQKQFVPHRENRVFIIKDK